MRQIKISIVFIIVLSIVLWPGYNVINNQKVVALGAPTNCVIIDAGHGAFDCGGVADDGTYEKNLNLAIAKKLNFVLQLYGVNTVLTRVDDNALGKTSTNSETNKVKDTKARVEIMQKYPNAIFVSIHQNKFSDTSVKGFQTFYKNGDNYGKALAENIQTTFVELLNPDKVRTAKSDNRNVYILNNSTIPTVIVECGFLSNSEDLSNLKSDAYQGKIAFTLAIGILKYFNQGK